MILTGKSCTSVRVIMLFLYITGITFAAVQGRLGVSQNNRYFVNGNGEPFFWLASTQWVIHREYTTAELATRFAEYLVENYDRDPEITWLLDYYEVHITPHANPDGRKIAETGIYWRKNTDNDDGCLLSEWWGTDLNRNSSFKWGFPGSSSYSCDETFRGPASVSEPETQAIQIYASSIFPDQRGPER